MSLRIVFLVVSVLVCIHFSYCQEFTTKEKFGSHAYPGGITVYNDVWGNFSGAQTITAQSGSRWCVFCSHDINKKGVKSYPHSAKIINKRVSDMRNITSSFDGFTKSNLAYYSLTYDIWCQQRKYEIMLWMTLAGDVGPLGPVTHPNLNLGGFTWTVHKGNNKANDVFSFVNQRHTFKGTVDIKAILEWVIAQKWIREGNAAILDDVQIGYEITYTPPNAEFCVTDFTVTAI